MRTRQIGTGSPGEKFREESLVEGIRPHSDAAGDPDRPWRRRSPPPDLAPLAVRDPVVRTLDPPVSVEDDVPPDRGVAHCERVAAGAEEGDLQVDRGSHVRREVVAGSGVDESETAQAPHLRITTGPAEACATSQPAALRLTVDHLHWLTSGATSLARGMNDAPKIVALVVAASVLLGGTTLSAGSLFGLVTASMVAGSLVAGRRVTHVLATKVTPMDHHDGFAANLVTAGLVTAGAVYGLPMSTTHVASGGIFSAGAQRGTLNRRTLRDILLAWAVTLPAAAALGMAVYAIAGWVQAGAS